MITSEEFLTYVAETVRDELWIDHDAYYFGNDIYIPACVSMWYGSYYEFYIRNAKVELRHSNQNALFKGWTVDPRETKPFYLSHNQVRFVTEESDFGATRNAELVFSGEEFFVSTCQYPNAAGWWQFPLPGMSTETVEQVTRFKKLVFPRIRPRQHRWRNGPRNWFSTTTRCPHGCSIIFVIRPPTPMTPTNSCIKPAILRWLSPTIIGCRSCSWGGVPTH